MSSGVAWTTEQDRVERVRERERDRLILLRSLGIGYGHEDE
jgi:hypothetical protein